MNLLIELKKYYDKVFGGTGVDFLFGVDQKTLRLHASKRTIEFSFTGVNGLVSYPTR